MNLLDITYEYLESLPKEVLGNVPSLPETRDIVALTGPRRVGKTFTLLSNVKRLLDTGKNALYISFDAPIDISVRELATASREIFPKGEIYLFLDEVQSWKDWEKNIRWLHDVGFRLYVSGSSFSLTTPSISSILRGRYVSYLVLPLSFGEICTTKGGTFREMGWIRRLFEEYTKWGGFPEIWKEKSMIKAEAILSTIFHRDIIERCRIRNSEIFRVIFRLVLSSYGNLFSVRSVIRSLKNLGIKISPTTLIEYLKCIREAFFAFFVPRFSYSQRTRELSPKKVYIVDPVFFNFLDKPVDRGRLLENLVFLELLRRGHRPRYYVTKRGEEVDFYVENAVIEVSYEYDEKHEEKLLKAAKETGAKPLYIVERGEGRFTTNIIEFLREGNTHIVPFVDDL